MPQKQIIGFDEVGRGPLAGPVVVACVLTVKKVKIPDEIIIRDSKKMTSKQKQKANDWIGKKFQFGIGQVSALQIDQKGISNAVRLAAFKALDNLKQKVKIDFSKTQLLVDGRDEWIEGSQAIVRGDDKIVQISMASIIAKVYRDNLMIKLSQKYSEYGFENHVGYGTAKHMQAIRKYSLIEGVHRKSFCKKIK
jgi:ribonuclease HII